MYATFSLDKIQLTKYLFFTGKGGVGKTSIACAVAVNLADRGKKVLLVSTDPASNLQDVFATELTGHGVPIAGVPNLIVANLNPEEAAREYREGLLAPYIGKLPDSVIANMAEQLSGSCTVETAAFDQFSHFITDQEVEDRYDHIIFDTAPTGHTLRMLQLPSAWSNFISESTHGVSCLGQLAGLEDKKDMYKEAVATLADPARTTLVMVAKPESSPLVEAERSSRELSDLGINNQLLIINAVLGQASDDLSRKIMSDQEEALANMPESLKQYPAYTLPLRSYNILGLERIRIFFTADEYQKGEGQAVTPDLRLIDVMIDDLYASGKKVIFVMGKGGVGKTTVAAAIALALARKGVKVHLSSTDPADHLRLFIGSTANITKSHIDERQEWAKYQEEVIAMARETMSEEDLEYVREDLRSPCTQEIAVFRAFAEIVEKSEDEVVIIDTAPTGHTLLLLDSTQSYHREVERTKGQIPPSVKKLLPRLRDEKQADVVIVTLPEATPVWEAQRLREELHRAGIHNKWWVVNQSLTLTKTSDPMLLARAAAERPWLTKVKEISEDNFAVIPWLEDASIDNVLKYRR